MIDSFIRIGLALCVFSQCIGCRTWTEARHEFVSPLNRFLHLDYAAAWRAMDLHAISSFYDSRLSSSSTWRESHSATLSRFKNLEQARVIIQDVSFHDGREDSVTVKLRLDLRGTTPANDRLAIDERLSVDCLRTGGTWAIVREESLQSESRTGDGNTFTEEARARGLVFTHRSGGVIDRFGRVQDYSPGAGLAVGDYDNDGFDDVFLVGGDNSRLFRNGGDGSFEDSTAGSGIRTSEIGEGRSAVFADYDNDGFLDLFIVRNDAPNELYRNLRDGTFQDVSEVAGLVKDEYKHEVSVGVCFADFNNDGWLDLYLLNSKNLFRDHPAPMYNALNATSNRLFLSTRDGRFRDATVESGVGHTGWALTVSTSDYDLDGDVDLMVGNDVGYNALFRNNGDATFENVTIDSGVLHRGANMSVSWGDLNGDGLQDLFVGAMDSNSRWMIDHPEFPAPAPWFINLFIRDTVLDILREMLHGNRLYINQGDGTFTERSEKSQVRFNGWAWSSLTFDYDNDGDLDVYGINGFISGEKPRDL